MKNYFEKLIWVFAFAFLFINGGCTKDEVNPSQPPNPVIAKPDTLATGWKKIIVDSTAAFSDIFFNSSTNGYLAGKKLYHSTDGGLTWAVVANKAVDNLAVTGDGKVFLVNMMDTLIARSIDGGATFSNFSSYGSKGFDVFFIDNDNGYYLTISGLFVTSNGGVNWTRTDIPGVYFPSSWSSLFFTGTNDGIILTNQEVYKLNGSLTNWTKSSFPGPVRSFSFQAVFISPDRSIYVTTLSGELFKSTNGGVSFTLLKTFPVGPGSFCDVHFVNNNTGYFSAGNRIYKTTDAGLTWNTEVALGNAVLVEIHFTDAGHGWACGTNGTVIVFK